MHPYAFAVLWPLVRVPLVASAGVNATYYFDVISGSVLGLIVGGCIALGLIVGDLMKPELLRSGWWPAGLFFIGLSLLAGISMVAGERMGSAEDKSAARERLEAARAELSLLKTEPESAASLLHQAKAKEEAAAREGGRVKCGVKCEALKGEAVELRKRVGLAERREALTAEIRALQPEARSDDAQMEALLAIGVPVFLAANLGAMILIIGLEVIGVAAPIWLHRQPRYEIDRRDHTRPAVETNDDKRLVAIRLFFEGDDGREIKQAAIARKLGVAQSTVSRWVQAEKKVRGKRRGMLRLVSNGG